MAEQVVVRESREEFYDRETKKVVGILREADPAKIIRFGSSVKSKLHPESDLDLCVLIDWKDDRPRFRIAQSLYRLLSKHEYAYPIDVELKVYRPAEFDVLLRRHNHFAEEIAAGEVVYERD